MNNSVEIKIRVYQSIKNKEACKRFADGYDNVLKSHGIKKVTSNNEKWFDDPGVYIIMVESPSGDKVYGGAKLQLKSKKKPLPIEEAIGELDPKIYDIIGKYKQKKVGEFCSLWNTKDMSGSGLSVLLTRVVTAKAGLFIASHLDLKSVYSLTAPWTVQMIKNVGFSVETILGDEGKFIYPRSDLIATVLVVHDIETLINATEKERTDIFNLRESPRQTKVENGPKGQIEVEYDLISNPTDFKHYSLANEEKNTIYSSSPKDKLLISDKII